MGVLGCMIVLSVEAGLVANAAKFIAEGNQNGLRAGVGMSSTFIFPSDTYVGRGLWNIFADFQLAFLFLIELPYDFGLNGMQFIYVRIQTGLSISTNLLTC